SSIQFPAVLCCVLVLVVVIAPQPVQAEEWQAFASSQSEDKGKQAGAFLPNELWIHVGDSITWTFNADQTHTATFLKQDTTPQQIRPQPPGVPRGGGPRTTPDRYRCAGAPCFAS